MNILLLIGIIILLGTIGGRVFRKINLPQIMGYILIGVLLGETFRGIISGPVIDSLRPLISLALGIIGFMIGAEIHFDRFKRYSRSIYTILFVETFMTFFLVAAVSTIISGKLYIGLMLGALSSATAPAATYAVLGEYKARGPVTTTTYSIVALDDALALLIYGFASVFARTLIAHDSPSLMRTLAEPLFQIFVSVLIGAVAGYILYKITAKVRDRDRTLSLALGAILLVVGFSIYFKVDAILASMVMGTLSSNLCRSDNREMFDLVKKFSPPIFILFFVLVGARLDARILTQGGVLFLATAYIISRSIGKLMGAYIGGKISRSEPAVTRYLGFCLFDQAGVAVGLSIAAFTTFSVLGAEAQAAGILIISIITATTFLLQLLAPPLIKYGAKKADELYRDVTEEDVIETSKVKDVMTTDPAVIKENNNLHQIMDIMKTSDAYTFPVVGMKGDFIGVISMGDIRDTFYEEQMDMLVLAGDITRELNNFAYADQDLRIAMDVFNKKNIDYVPVMEKEGSRRLVGELEYRKVADYINKEVLLRRKELGA